MRLICLSLVIAASSAHAATFTVMNTNNSGSGSLRQAILNANASSGTDTVAFDIPGFGPHSIQPTSALPTITDAVIIDGYTQPGAAPNTNGPDLGGNAMLTIELDGTNAGSNTHGLTITAGSSVVQGLVINRFSLNGVLISGNGATENRIQGNFIGTDTSGTSALGNGLYGVSIVDAPSNTVGGTIGRARNVISGNDNVGVVIVGGPACSGTATGNLIQGNFIGTDVTGTLRVHNLSGIEIMRGGGPTQCPPFNNTIGGTAPGAGNVISGNARNGVVLYNVDFNRVQGNYIGTDVSGLVGLGNSLRGILIKFNAQFNTIGGTGSGEGNIIAFNGRKGVWVRGPFGTGNAIRSNSIYSNMDLGIDLSPDLVVTLNDAGDSDFGANDL